MRVSFHISAALAGCLVLVGSPWVFAGARHSTIARSDDRARFNPMTRHYRGVPDRGEVVRLRDLPQVVAEGGVQGPQGPTEDPVEPLGCSFDDVWRLDAAQTLTYLRSHDAACLYFLWTPDERLASVFTQQKMLAVLAAIGQESAAYDATRNNSGHLLELLMFVRVGFYHDFYDRPVTFNHAQIRDETIDALQAVEQTRALLAPLSENVWTADVERILNQWIVTVDTVSDILADFYPTLEDIVAFYANDAQILARLAGRPLQRDIIHSTLYAFQRSLQRHDVQQATRPRLVQKLETLALTSPLVQRSAWLLNNTIWTLSRIVLRLEGDLQRQALSAVERVFLAYDPEDELEIEPHLWAILALPMGQDGCYSFGDGSRQVCRDEIAADIRAALFPFRYAFDDGALVIDTSLSRGTALELHTATGQVRRQFVSITGYAHPRPEDTNDTLSMVVYASKRDYEVFHPFLTGLGTNNGGIYIESIATFYTYQREPSESVYTLEDLTRHEYVHYLSGRFLIEGGFNESDFYEGDRLTWFDEGFAEFLAGSTWCGVKTRSVLVAQVASDDQTMSVDEMVHAGYISGFKFYRYAALFIEFLLAGEGDHGQELSALITAIRDTDIDGYDAIVNSWVNLDGEFQAFLVDLTDSTEEEWPVIPFVDDPDDATGDATCNEDDAPSLGVRGDAVVRARTRWPFRTARPPYPRSSASGVSN